jgi:hypothetical protein
MATFNPVQFAAFQRLTRLLDGDGEFESYLSVESFAGMTSVSQLLCASANAGALGTQPCSQPGSSTCSKVLLLLKISANKYDLNNSIVPSC